jgi:Dyp-type peroxidase family
MSDSADEHFDMQALVRGFGASLPWAVFTYGIFGDDPERNREFLKRLPLALGVEGPTSVSDLDAGDSNVGLDNAFNIAFTIGGLAKVGVAPDVLSSFPPEYIQGMAKRADINRDGGRSAPACWEDHWRDGTVDLWIAIYAASDDRRDRQHQRLKDLLGEFDMPADKYDLANRFLAGDTNVWIDDAGSQPEREKALEHFGFEDGISNPPIKGLTPDGLVTTNAGGKLDKAGNWLPIAAGEFLYGHLDEIGEIPLGPTPTDIGVNGTHMIFRKLSQNVDSFRCYIRMLAGQYGMKADELAEKLVGRKRNGSALVASPPPGDSNDFVYGNDTLGMICPLGSHVRRSNPRDSLGFETLLVDRHRILRRGIPYGKLVPRETKQAEVNPPVRVSVDGVEGEYPGQGLLFIALNVDIRRQFEFVQSQWMNLGNDLNQGSDRDPIVGSHDPDHPKHNRMVFLTESEEAVVVCPEIPAFVETRGGDYFFLPGLHAYASIVDGHEYR